MITVRATTVESYRLYREPPLETANGLFEIVTADELEARLRGIDTATPEARVKMARGTAFHRAVEVVGEIGHLPDDDVPIVVDDYAFAAPTIRDARRGLDEAVPEVEGSMVLDVDGVPVRVTGHSDWLRGLDMWEFKTSDKPIPADRHADSMQWRIYHLLFGVERVTYRHVHLAEDRRGIWYARAIDDVVLFPYPKLRDDVVRCLRGLLEFASLRGCLDAMEVDDAG